MIPDHFTIQFGNNFKLAAQQQDSRFRKAAQVETGCTGEAKTHNLILPSDDEEVTGHRYKKVELRDLETEKRWVRPRKFQQVSSEDEFDETLLGPTIMPGGTHIQVHAGAYGRRLDRVFLDGLLGTNYVGSKGVTTSEIPGSNQVADNFSSTGTTSSSCLTVDKIIKAVKILRANDAYSDERRASGVRLWGAMTAEMEENLLYLANAGTTGAGNRLFSKDFMPPVLNDDGSISFFLGVNWIRSELLPRDANAATKQYAAVWTSDAVHLDIWGDLKTSIDRRPDMSNAIQFLSQYKIGAARSEDKKVVKIGCLVASL
jgi:Phage capsid protein